MNDTSTFGSFVNAFLARFRDDFVKLPCLSFSVLSASAPSKVDADDVRYKILSCVGETAKKLTSVHSTLTAARYQASSERRLEHARAV